MNEIKYEAVFGDQGLFDKAPPDAEFACVNTVNQVRHYYKSVAGEMFTFTVAEGWVKSSQSGWILAAGRAITYAPVWTKLDQQAGKLPAVDGKCRHLTGELVKTVIAVTKTHIVLDADNGTDPDVLYHDEFMQYYRPIETPEERAMRVRIEWSRTASKIANETQGGMSAVYDAIISGELKMPEVK